MVVAGFEKTGGISDLFNGLIIFVAETKNKS